MGQRPEKVSKASQNFQKALSNEALANASRGIRTRAGMEPQCYSLASGVLSPGRLQPLLGGKGPPHTQTEAPWAGSWGCPSLTSEFPDEAHF